jgi:excisionase family DNA binding protein
MNEYSTIYSNHAYGDSVYYTDDDREWFISTLAESFGETVEEFKPGFMENENEIDLIAAYNDADEDPNNLQDSWHDLNTSVDLMTDDAKAIFVAFRAQMAPLNDVLTITEAADEFDISREAVEKAIRVGRLPARQSGATWLFRREDAAALWNHVAQVGAVVMVIAAGVIAYL